MITPASTLFMSPIMLFKASHSYCVSLQALALFHFSLTFYSVPFSQNMNLLQLEKFNANLPDLSSLKNKFPCVGCPCFCADHVEEYSGLIRHLSLFCAAIKKTVSFANRPIDKGNQKTRYSAVNEGWKFHDLPWN